MEIKMEKNSSKIITGCGIGCGVFVLLLIIAGVFIYTYVKNTFEDVKQIEESNQVLEAKYGKIEDYSPITFIDSSRLVTFIEIRDSINFYSSELSDAFNDISKEIDKKLGGEHEDKSFWETMGLVNKGIKIVPKMINYFSERSRLLLKNDFSPGEYYYYYTLGYYNHLKKNPGDGPAFDMTNNGGNGPGIQFGNDKDEMKRQTEAIKRNREVEIRYSLNKLFQQFFRNRIAELDSSGIANDEYNILKTEFTRMIENDYRIPFEDELPNIIKFPANLDTKLESSYNPQLNAIEMKQIVE